MALAVEQVRRMRGGAQGRPAAEYAGRDARQVGRCVPAAPHTGKLEHRVRVEGFTQPGDPLRQDYGYQNGVRGFIQSVSLRRDLPQAKALAYTAGCIHARDRLAEITAITDTVPDAENARQVFVEKLFAGEGIRSVAMSQAEGFAEELRMRIQ